MKLSVVVAGRDAPANAFVVWRGFEESIQKAASMGYHGVELALGGREDVDERALDGWLRASGLTVSCVSTGLVYAQRGLYMTHPDPAKRRETVDTFRGLVALAETHGGLVNIGRARGWVGEGQTPAEAEGLFFDCLGQILPAAERAGVTLLFEPVNRYEINFMNSLDEASALLDKAPGRSVGIMADCFHMNIEDDTFDGAIRRNARYIRYVHVADSNRKAPGKGHTDFPAILRSLRAVGYDGWLSAEILPGNDPDQAARDAADYLLPLIAAG